MIINTNVLAMNAGNNLRINNDKKSKSMEKLSSGLRINRAADDAAGLTISEKMRGQIRGLHQASRNIQDGISLVQTAESGFQGITDIIQRQKELIIKGMNGTYSDNDRKAIDLEISQLNDAIESIAEGTSFNTINLLARDDYQIFADRSSQNVEHTTSGPFSPTTTNYESKTHFWPIGSPETPKTVTASSTVTTIKDDSNITSTITSIILPNGEGGYNLYSESEQVHTETTITTESTHEQVLVTDPRYKEPDVKYNTPDNVFFQTKLIPNGTFVGQYPDFGGAEDRFTYIEIEGANYTLADFTLMGFSETANGVRATYQKDGIEIEKSFIADSISFTAQFTIHNNSGIDNRDIRIGTAFKPQYDGNYSLASSAGVPTDGTASSAQIPDSGTAFEITNDLVDYEFSFLTGANYLKPDTVVTKGSQLTSDSSLTHPIVPSWSRVGLNNGETMEFGIRLSNFIFKMDVYRDTDMTTETIDQIDVTVTTDIKDIDYAAAAVSIQTGDKTGDMIKIPLFDARSSALGISSMGVSSYENAKQSLVKLDSALNTVLTYRSVYGAYQNRLEHTMNNVTNYSENLTAAESRIRDTDMAKEMMELTRSQILTEAGQAMLAQANTTPQSVLKLLG
ncbi:flagellin [Cohnella boryungensis]|uniref:Flagellin n=1 Tax=Cohnella boryungensis TaxID=768479 RepID=A0ABV8S692_9BACL